MHINFTKIEAQILILFYLFFCEELLDFLYDEISDHAPMNYIIDFRNAEAGRCHPKIELDMNDHIPMFTHHLYFENLVCGTPELEYYILGLKGLMNPGVSGKQKSITLGFSEALRDDVEGKGFWQSMTSHDISCLEVRFFFFQFFT